MITTTARGFVPLSKQLQLLRMTPVQKKRSLRRFGRAITRNARQNARAQKTVTGESFAPRRAPRKRRMMKNLAATKHLKVYAGPNNVTVTWKNNYMGKIARAQHDGYQKTVSVQQMKERTGNRGPDYDAPATKRQADALIKMGYRAWPIVIPPKKNKKYRDRTGHFDGIRKGRRVSKKWIMENLTMGQAGLILREMGYKSGDLDKWEEKIEPRPILGVTKKDVDEYISGLAKDAAKRIAANKSKYTR